MHITSRTQLLSWLANNAPNKLVQRAVDRGKTTVHGLFKGGWVVSTEYKGCKYIVGIRPIGIKGRMVCGLLTRVPWEYYVGGETPINKGDSSNDSSCPFNKTGENHQDHPAG